MKFDRGFHEQFNSNAQHYQKQALNVNSGQMLVFYFRYFRFYG